MPHHLLRPALAAAAMLLAAGAAAQPLTRESCDTKREAIVRDLDAAKANGQKQRVRGLERALAANERNCSEAGLQAEHRRRVLAQEREVAERERDLADAKRKGRADKIAQREEKLREEQAELQRLRAVQ